MTAYLLLFILLFLPSCSLIDLQQKELYRTTPSSEYEVLDKEESISIRFTEDVDTLSVQNITGLRRYDTNAELSFKWKDKRKMEILPVHNLYPGLEYRLVFKGIYINNKGTEREADLSLPFYLQSSENNFLTVLDYSPADGAVLDSSSSVHIRFDKDVDAPTLNDALQISPSIKVKKTWNTENTLIITPLEDWDNLTSYRISINETLCSKDGYPLIPIWESGFYVEDGSSIPTVIYCGSCSMDRLSGFPWISENLETLKEDQGIRIKFSETMDHEKTESSFSISPSIAGDLYWIEEDLIFCPSVSFRSSQDFRLEIRKDAESVNAVGMADSFRIDFSPDISPVTVLSLECSSPGGFLLNEYNCSEAYDLPVQPVSPFDLSFHFTFSAPFCSDIEKQKVQDSLGFYEMFSSGGSPQPGLFSWSNDYRMTVIYSGFKTMEDSDYYYMMELSGGSDGICNSEGSYMEESLRQLFRTVHP